MQVQQLWDFAICDDYEVETVVLDDVERINSIDSVSTCDSENTNDFRTN